MQNNNKISRRKFIGGVLTTVAVFNIVPRHVLGGNGFIPPSDKITLGFIGTGKQSNGLANNFLKLPAAHIVAASDVDALKLKKFQEKIDAGYAEKAGSNTYKSCDAYKEYEKILTRKDIDAVVIATPDHWHGTIAIQAAKAGKDIYCEKPLTLTVKEGRDMVDAVRKYKRVLQTGSMQRSDEKFRRACELVRNGYIGDIESILVSVGGPPVPCNLPGEPVPEYLDWERWLGPAAFRPYHPILAPPITDPNWAMWRKYREFGGGYMTDWGAHMFDIVQWALDMDDSGPTEIIPPDGKEYKVLTYRYKNGITVKHEEFGRGNAVRFIGSKGRIDVSRSFLEATPESILQQQLGSSEIHLYKSTGHHQDWLDCIKSRNKPICDVEVGHRTASMCNIGNMAYELKRPLKWNPKKEKFKKDKEANRMLARKMREPYSYAKDLIV